jgi:hypothetical protein
VHLRVGEHRVERAHDGGAVLRQRLYANDAVVAVALLLRR